jgi:hypothetical protein
MLMRLQQGTGEIFEKLREVIRKEAATERRSDMCKGLDIHAQRCKSVAEILKKKALDPSKGWLNL